MSVLKVESFALTKYGKQGNTFLAWLYPGKVFIIKSHVTDLVFNSFDFSLPNSLFCNDYVKVRALIKSCVGCAHLRPAPQVLVPGRRKIKSFSTFPLGHFSIYCSVLSSVDMGTLIQTWLCKVTCLPSRETFYLITIRVYRVCKVRAVNK